MVVMTRAALWFGAILSVWIAAAGPAHAAEQGLFINLTSDQIDRATMAVFLAQKALAEKQADVTLFLNVEGVRLADRRLTRHTHANGKDLHELLAEFLAAGGKVFACPMCMQYVGSMTEQDLLRGVVPATMDGVWSALFAREVRVLSY